MEYYFVSPQGNDCNNGSKESPFLTLERARDAARQSEQKNVTVYLRQGRYFRRSTFELDSRDDGTVYQAYPGEKVIFDGGVILNQADIKPYRDGIVMVDLKPYGISYGEYGTRGFRHSYINAPNELFIDEEPYTVSRYPKEERIPLHQDNIIDGGSIPKEKDFSCRPAMIRFDDERIERWVTAQDAYLAGFFNASWADDCIKIAKIDPTARTITTQLPHLFGFKDTGHSSWYVVNLLEELTEPGEYYLDPKKEVLYFYPRRDVSNSLIQLSVFDQVMVAIEGVREITIDGIIFENSRNSGVYLEGGENCRISNCTFRNLGIMAIQIGQGASPQPDGLHTCHGERAEHVPLPHPISRQMGSWHEYLYEFAAWDNKGGKNHLIENCEVYEMGAGGILLSGGNRKTLGAGNNRVHNCHFYRVNRLDKTYKAAVNIMGVGNQVTHCEIHDLPGMAIYLHGNDHLIEYNKIHHVLLSVSDSGAIYMGRDMSEVGNIFRYNFIYSIHNPHKSDLGVCAIYFDDWSVYNMVYANYFYDIVSDGKFFFSTIYHTCGGLTSVGNNILIDCFPGLNPNIKSNANLHMHEDPLSIVRVHTQDERDFHGVDITSDVYRERYPYLYETYVHDYNPGTKFWHNRVYVNQYRDFVDAEHMDFRMTEDAEHIHSNMPEYRITDDVFGLNNETIDIKRIDFSAIGRIR